MQKERIKRNRIKTMEQCIKQVIGISGIKEGHCIAIAERLGPRDLDYVVVLVKEVRAERKATQTRGCFLVSTKT